MKNFGAYYKPQNFIKVLIKNIFLFKINFVLLPIIKNLKNHENYQKFLRKIALKNFSILIWWEKPRNRQK